MTADDLLEIARELAVRDPARPRQSSLKRSTSTAYYALFHALAHECVRVILGGAIPPQEYWKTVSPVYRIIDHGSAKRVFNRFAKDPRTPPVLRDVALAFVELQEARIQADYDPTPSFTRRDVLQNIRRAEGAVQQLRNWPVDIRRDVIVQLIAKQR